MADIYVKDPRPDNEGSLAEVPRLRTFADIVQYFAPLTIDQSQGWEATPVGEACWKVVGFHVTWPQVVLAPKVLDKQGVYIPDKLVYWRYPGAPARLTGDHRPKYFGDQGLFARTKYEGNGAEFVVTGDHWVGPDRAGPDSVWVAAEPGGPQYSDAVHGLGMRVNTDHLIVSPIFQQVVKPQSEEAEEPPEPDEPSTPDEPTPPDEPPTPDPDEGETPVETPDPPATVSDHELIVVVGGQEVGRISVQSKATGDTYIAIVSGADQTVLGYLHFAPADTAGTGLVLATGSGDADPAGG